MRRVLKGRRWGRWWLDTKKPTTLNIEPTPGHILGILLSELRDEAHWQRWKELVVAPTPGITPQDPADIEKAREAIACWLSRCHPKPLGGNR